MPFLRPCRNLVLICLLLQGCASQLQPKATYRPPPGATPEEVGNVNTGDLLPTVGHQGDRLGARVVGAEDDGDDQVLQIELPVDPTTVDRVEVIAPGSGSEVLSREAQILQNYENDNVGITVRVPKSDNMGFRLKLIDHPDEDEWLPRRHQ